MMVIGSRLCLLVAGVTFVVGSAFAQAPNEATPDTKPNLSKRTSQTASSTPKKWIRPSRSRRPRREIRTWCRRQRLQAALPRSQNERVKLAQAARLFLEEPLSGG
jgi:hypothetical protein